MPIYYDITTDGLYLRGKKDGREEGYQEGYQEGYLQGYQEGFAEGVEVVFVAVELLQAGKSVEEVVSNTWLNRDQVTRLHHAIHHGSGYSSSGSSESGPEKVF